MIPTIVIIIFFAICIFALLRFDIQMFQGNSYRLERYFRWWSDGKMLSHYRWLFIPALFAFANIYMTIIAMAIMCFYAFKEFSTKYKTPIVYTDRVKRLFATSLLLVGIILTASFLLFDRKGVVFSMSVVLLFSNFVMIVANILNSPIEKAISRWYVRDAKKIIASHPNLIVIGITGSYGKTSTKNYLYRVLSERYNVLITPGNFNTLLGVVRTIREKLRPQHQIFIVEMGAKQRGDIKEICDLVNPTMAIISSIGVAHMETFGSVENIQATKFELVNSLPDCGVAVLNFDSEKVAQMREITSKCRVVSYGVANREADICADEVKYSNAGLSFALKLSGDQTQSTFTSHLLGEGNILNLLASIVVGDLLKVEVKNMQTAISQLQPVEHRLSMKKNNSLTILDDAYNSNPTGAKMALSVLRDFSRSEGAKRIVITPGFVEMGDMQFEANKNLGRLVAQCSDYALVVNATNREAILAGLNDENFAKEKIYVAQNLADAHKHLSTIIKAGDIILYENDLPDTFK